MPADRHPPNVIEVADGFWNIRGSFKIGGILDIGTQASLVRLGSGKYVLLDACAFSDEVHRWIGELTDGGDNLEAVLHLHPFHTLYVAMAHERYPKATLFGTARHIEKLGELPWDERRVDEAAVHQLFAEDFEFTVPRGVAFISADEKLHFASVIAFHRASRTLHVDDTLMYIKLPLLFRWIARDVVRLHPTLAMVLEKRAGATDDFRAWAGQLVELCRDVRNLCAAHSAVLLERDNRGASIAERVQAAVARVEGTLRAHERALAG
jgi:hypothetical protein